MTHIFENYEGKFVLSTSDTCDGEIPFDTYEEARLSMEIIEYIRLLIDTATQFALASEKLVRLKEIYADRGYAPGEENGITGEDLKVAGITEEQLLQLITLCQQVEQFLTGGETAPCNHQKVLNQVRTNI
jgi:hypothetical protein